MAKTHTAVKVTFLLWLLCMGNNASAQQYSGCSYGGGKYNENPCKKAKAIAPPAAAIKVYPNPAGRFFTLQLPSSYSNQQLMVQVYNAQQELVLTKRIVAKVLRHDIQLPMLANGLYQVTVSSSNATQTLLLNIQN